MTKRKYFRLKEYNGEPVITEPGLQDCEEETAIYFSARTTREGYAGVSSNQGPIARSLLKHRDFILEEIYAIGSEVHPKVVYVAGRLPINCIRITAATGSTSVRKIITQSARKRRA